jgi:small-conductance mechanosensitive channel
MRWLRTVVLVLCLGVLPGLAPLFLPAAAVAQVQPQAPDYAMWEEAAKRTEEALAADRISTVTLEELRKRVVEWRARFTDAQNINADQITTVKGQIAALGPAPTADAPDPPAVAERRKELTSQLNDLQAPSLSAVEARTRADGLVRQIDSRVRARQASELLRLSPTAFDPRTWDAGIAVLTQGGRTLWAETGDAWSDPQKRTALKNNLPLIILLLVLAAFFMIRAPGFIERQANRLLTVGRTGGRDVAAAVISFGQVLVPVGGVTLLVAAIHQTEMTGTRTGALLNALPVAAVAFFAMRWIGSWVFRHNLSGTTLTDRPIEANFHTTMLGLMMSIEAFRQAFITEVRPPVSMAAQSVWATPLVVIAGIFLFRLGVLIRPKTRPGSPADSAVELRNWLLRILSSAVLVVSVVAPFLAAVGYVAAANALMWPMLETLALIGFFVLVQRFGTDIYLLVTRQGERGREGLAPVVLGTILALIAVPLLALVWGAREADLSETWTRLSEGVRVGETQISPTVVLAFAAIFLVGYGLTRLTQAGLRTAILPRTRIEKGVQNAIVSGLGYVGIFLAALAAMTGAGIDLSALGYVAGALSIGIGFGLQNIVQNFVSGIILLIERPISEGDMIEVNGQTGTVRGISVRSTWIETFDRSDVIVPNADLISGVVTNLTRRNLTGRLILPVGVAYGSDTRKVEALLREIAEAEPVVLVDPRPNIFFTGLGADGLNFEIRAILSDVNLKMGVQTEMLHKIVERFAAEGIEIPFAQRDIWLRNAGEIFGRKPGPAAPQPKPEPPAPPVEERPRTPDRERINNDPSEEDET